MKDMGCENDVVIHFGVGINEQLGREYINRSFSFRNQNIPTVPNESIPRKPKSNRTTDNMQTNFVRLFVLVVVAIVFAANLIENVEATYRKPPFNGSIFGKRGSSTDYDNAGKALSSMCEIASEACQAWFPVQDK